MSGVKRLFVMQVGSIENDLAWNLAGINAATRDDPGRRAQWVEVPCLAYLVEHDSLGWVLFDTGFRAEVLDRLPDFARQSFPGKAAPGGDIEGQLERLGVRPGDISQVIVSHMHWDHGGGLSLFSGTPAGRGVMVGQADFAYGLETTHRDARVPFAGGGYFREHFELQDISFDLVDKAAGDFDLAPGIRVLQLEGHTPQVLGLLVTLPGDGAVLLPSDAIYMSRNLEPTPTPPGIIYDSLGFQRTVQKVRQLTREHHARIIYPHDFEQMDRIRLAPECYR